MKKLILLTALTTALFADYCTSYVNLMNKESEKGIQLIKLKKSKICYQKRGDLHDKN